LPFHCSYQNHWRENIKRQPTDTPGLVGGGGGCWMFGQQW